MALGDVNTFHSDGWWYNRVQGEKRPAARYLGKQDAVRHGRMLAMSAHGDHFIREMGGTISIRDV